MTEIVRWTANRKAVVVLAVAEGVLTPVQLFELHGITAQELSEWQQLFSLDGPAALRTTRLKLYRGASNEPRYAGRKAGGEE